MDRHSATIFKAFGYRDKDLRLVREFMSPAPRKAMVRRLLDEYDIDVEAINVSVMLAGLLKKFPEIKHRNSKRLSGIIDFFRFGNMSIIDGFRRVARALVQAGIPFMPLKGVAFRHLFPDEPRVMYDADILVPISMYHKAVEAAGDAGFNVAHELYHSCDLQMGAMMVDIHKSMFKCGFTSLEDFAWTGARQIDAFGEKAFLPTPEAQALSLLMNTYNKLVYDDEFFDTAKFTQASQGLQWVVDLARVLRSAPSFDFKLLVGMAAKLGHAYRVRTLLEILERFLPGEVPGGAIEYMKLLETNTDDNIARDMRLIEFFKRRDKAKKAELRVKSKVSFFSRIMKMLRSKRKGYLGITVSDEQFGEYWHSIKKHADDMAPANVMHLDLAGFIIRIEHHFPEFDSFFRKQFGLFKEVLNPARVDASITIYDGKVDSLLSYLVPKSRCAKFRVFYKDDLATPAIDATIDGTELLWAHDRDANAYYIMAPGLSEREKFQWYFGDHILVAFLYRIMMASGRAVLHSAAVGTNGKGVLLAGRGGAGKSSLAISALLNGLDYVSDDYVALKKDGGGVSAHPIYATTALSDFSVRNLPGFNGVVISDNWNGKKKIYDLEPHVADFAKSLVIKAVVLPNITGAAKPSINKIDKGRVIVQMLHSTIGQVCYDKDPSSRSPVCMQSSPAHMVHLMSFVKDLDFYEIDLSPDFDANINALKEFIEKL
ncbi:MAG: nucleotidyltransferase family protein [Alphaproteobacteria bacterium]|nr:nucleotidyltransferase family protein [Alphaproteobacteria bacterium]